MKERYVVIMAGGRGERFWPQSRLSRPKHLLPIVGDEPMLTQTVNRLRGLVPMENIFIITNVEQKDAVIEVCPMLPSANVVAEPVGRDTAAAVGLATLLVKHRNPQAAFAMLPADHVIHDVDAFQRCLKAAFETAEAEEALVTVGIQPEYPATGYGYIHRAHEISEKQDCRVFVVEEFKEKPNAETAKSYIDSGAFYWNAGMFFWRVPVISKEFERLTPDLWAALGKIDAGIAQGRSLDELLEAHYPDLEKISIDYAVMEKAAAVRVVESNFDWDDVGEWPAVARHHDKDEAGNVIRGDAIIQGGGDNIVISSSGHLTAVLGVEDLIVVHTADATLICPRSRAQDIKKLVHQVRDNPKYKHLM